jgi:hypothetical protein
MSDLIPYFAGLIMVLFGIAFGAALQALRKSDKESPAPPVTAK